MESKGEIADSSFFKDCAASAHNARPSYRGAAEIGAVALTRAL